MDTAELKPLMATLAPRKVIDARRSTAACEVAVQDIRWDEPGEIRIDSGPLCLVELSDHAATPAPGRAAYHIRLDNQKDHPVGRLNFLPPGARRTVRWTAGSRQAVVCVMEPSRVGLLAGMDWQWRDIDPARTVDVRNERLSQVMRWLAEEARQPSFASELQISSLLTLLAIELHRQCERSRGERVSSEPQPPTGRLGLQQLQTIRDLIDAQATCGGPTLQELATACRMGARELSTLFHHTMGQTLRSYVAASHIERARLLLADRQLLIKQIAFQCGFRSAAAFGEAFRRATGQTPQQYRQSLGVPPSSWQH